MYDVFPGLMYRQVRQPFLELQRNVPAGGLGVPSLLASSTHERVGHEGLVNGGKRPHVLL